MTNDFNVISRHLPSGRQSTMTLAVILLTCFTNLAAQQLPSHAWDGPPAAPTTCGDIGRRMRCLP